MVFKMLSFKSYLIHFIKSNRISFILLCLYPFIVITLPTISLYSQPRDMINILLLTTFGYGFLLSIALPIFQFRFLFNKSATDTYFALPIKRNKLFLFEYFLGYLLLTIPLCIQFCISYSFFLFNNPFTPNITRIPLIYATLLLIFLSVQYTITTLFTVKSNNIFDCLVFNLFELAAPIAFIIILQYFIQTQIYTIIGGDIGIYVDEVLNLSLIHKVLTFPLMFASLVDSMMQNIFLYTEFSSPITLSYQFNIFCYWSIIGCICFFFAYRHFLKRTAEDSQQKSTTLLGYPFLITFILVCSLLCIKFNSFIFLFIILIFCCYFILLSISMRKIYVTIKHVILFICLTLCSLGFQYCFQSTNGFHLIHEYPDVKQIQSIEVEIRIDSYPVEQYLYLFDHETDEEIYSYRFQSISPSEFPYILQTQSTISNKAVNNKNNSNQTYVIPNSQYTLHFIYTMKDNSTVYRYYYISSSQKQILKDFISTIQQDYDITVQLN